MTIPLIKSFRATTLSKAFLINAFVSAVIATVIVEVRQSLEQGKGTIYSGLKQVFTGDNPFNTEVKKIRTTFFVGFIVAFMVYNLLYLLMAFGGGMISSKSLESYF